MKKLTFLLFILFFVVGCSINNINDEVNNSYLNNSDLDFVHTEVTFEIPEVSSALERVNFRSGPIELDDWLTVFDGYGFVKKDKNNILLRPKISVSDNETHAALVLFRDVFPRDFILDIRMSVNKQLRKSPNPWESGWVLFNYVDDKNFFYFVFKTNGIELGRVVNGRQQFILTRNEPALKTNVIYRMKFVFDKDELVVFVDSAKVLEYKMTLISSNRIALYSEDAEVEFLGVRAFKA